MNVDDKRAMCLDLRSKLINGKWELATIKFLTCPVNYRLEIFSTVYLLFNGDLRSEQYWSELMRPLIQECQLLPDGGKNLVLPKEIKERVTSLLGFSKETQSDR